MSTRTAFDPLAPLGPRTLIEASAGTGKTYALASLAVRLLADGDSDVEQLLVVTFGRLAAEELRDRIRRRMQDVLDRSAAVEPIDDPLAAAIAAEADAPARRARLQHALDHIDGLAVSTIHAFAQQAIATLGSSAGVDPDLSLVGTDPREGPASGADALAVASMEVQQRRRAGEPVAALPSANKVTELVERLANMPDLELRPDGIDVDFADDKEVLAGVARHASELARQRRQRAGVRNFSELLTDLRDALRGPHGKRAAAAIRARFSVALIDEFQDTDRVQWEIFDTLFGRDGARMVLVGDPKQAIYRFRGADVATYVHVADGEIDRTALSTNWRSDAAVVDALGVLFDGATFGDEIAFQPVQAAPEHASSRLRRDDGSRVPALSVRLVVADELYPRGDDGLPARNKTKPFARKPIDEPAATSAIVSDVVAQAVDLLEHGRIATADGDRACTPGDLAVLTRTRHDGARVHRALRRAGVPAVLRADDPLLDSPAATEWRILLAAIGRPSDPRLARAAALGVFGDADPATPVGDAALEAFQERLGDWGATATRRGVAELLSQVRRDASYAARALAGADGDRLLTDLDHIGELLVVQVPPGPATIPVLEACLATDPDDATGESESVATRRVDTDDDAVQVMTIHKSKGLEFGVVFVVGVHKRQRDSEVLFHDPDTGRRVVDLYADDPDAKSLAVREQQGDASRLLYVALTRAKHATAVWWSHERYTKHSALTRLLFGRDPATGAIDPERYDVDELPVPEPDDALALVERVAARCPTGIEVAVVGASAAPRWAVGRHVTADVGELMPARLDRAVTSGRRRWSYTSITAERAGHEASFDGMRGGHDEGLDEVLDPSASAEQTNPPDVVGNALDDPTVSKLATLPAGAAFGTMVHAVLERVDFAAEDLEAQLAHEIGRELEVRRLDLAPIGLDGPDVPPGVELLRDGLAGVVTSPLGPAFDDRTLRQLGPRDRLNELDFDLHLGRAGRAVRDGDLGRTVLEHLPDDDPFHGWAEQLAAGRFGVDLAGSLTGSIDLVARVGSPARPRFVVVDYKTNRLHDAGASPGPDAYGASSMVDAMIDHDYPLQALLYAVALHRFLRWRLPDYRPDVHLGGAAYLFVRGMAGPGTRVRGTEPDGVCRWAIPPALVEALSDRLAGR